MENKDSNLLRNILLIVGAVTAVAAIAYAVYCFFFEDEFDDFDEDFYFDDEDIEDLLEDN